MNENEKNIDWKNRELGALWKKTSKTQNYLSGFVKVGEFGVEQEIKLIIFTNKNKSKNPNAPDFVIYQSDSFSNKGNSTGSAKVPTAPVPVEMAPPPVDANFNSSEEEVPELLS